MTGWPTIDEVLRLHTSIVAQTGGSAGLRDAGALESAIQQPLQEFGEVTLYPTILDKASALGYFLISNHPFVDGNKRIGHACVELVLLRNGLEIAAPIEVQERVILSVASSKLSRPEFTQWVSASAVPIERE